ncbi:MAG: HDOD domain-containing protein [Planctomycetes bacterium]|nr:HDOD domain-containing protein [Planctomycetota bacterium]
MSHALIARQPIVDRRIEVRAYELLFRAQGESAKQQFNGDTATATVAIHTLLDLGLYTVAGEHPVFVNLTRGFFTDELYTVLPAERVVLEVLEDIVPDADFLKAVERARKAGYRIALDDYIHSEDKWPLVALADYVKVDAGQLDDDGLRNHARILARPGLKLLAEKIETRDRFWVAKDAGYDLFQGWFYAQPDLVKRKRLTANRASLLQVLAMLEDPKAEFEKLGTLIERDLALSHKLLRYVNSAALSLSQRVDSVRHACTLLGMERVRSITRMLLLSEVTDKPRELMLNALSRARLCQLLAANGSKQNDQKYFTVGLFSLLDVYLDTTMEALLAEMPLSDEIKSALLEHGGSAGSALDAAVACERADWNAIENSALPASELQRLYVSALNWTLQVERSLSDMKV